MQQEENQFDVIIVGAGPAGSAAAIALSKSELKVALVDKYDFPRDKTCGDVIPGPTFKALNYLGVDFSNELKSMQPQFPIKQTAVISNSGKRITKTWKQFAYNAKRLDFDNKLLQIALKNPNVSFLPKSKITTINRRVGKVFCTASNQPSFSAPIIIGCNGANSVVKRKLAKMKRVGKLFTPPCANTTKDL